MKRVIVTGASGFIGRHTLPHLISQGFEILAISRQGVTEKSPQVRWSHANLHDQPSVQRLFKEFRPTHLLHLAWDVRHGLFWTSRENLDWVASSIAMYRAFEEYGGQRFVGSGTCAEYQWGGAEPFVEGVSPLFPNTLYGQAKKTLYELLDRAAQDGGPKFAWGRIFFLYGLHEDPKRLIRYICESLLRGDRVNLSDGRQVRDFLHVDDVARAFSEILVSGVTGAFNIAAGQGHSIREVVGMIEEITNVRGLVTFGDKPRAANDPDFILGNNRRLRELTGWAEPQLLRQGLNRYIDWLRSESALQSPTRQ